MTVALIYWVVSWLALCPAIHIARSPHNFALEGSTVVKTIAVVVQWPSSK